MEQIDYDGPVPVFRQVYLILRERITSGQVPPGRPIASKRTLVQELGVAPNTVEKAIQLLKDDGFVEGVQGRGVFARPRGDWPEG